MELLSYPGSTKVEASAESLHFWETQYNSSCYGDLIFSKLPGQLSYIQVLERFFSAGTGTKGVRQHLQLNKLLHEKNQESAGA